MHALLTPNPLSAMNAVDACGQYLTARWGRWWTARRFLPRDMRDDVTPLLAWHRLTRDLLEAQRDTDAARRALDECTHLLDEVGRGELGRPLAAALAPVVQRYRIPDVLLRGRLHALERDGHVHAYETREELLALTRRTAHPEGRLLLRVLGEEGERNEVLADALATGLQLTAWVTGLREALARGHLYVPMEELVRYGVDLQRLEAGRMDGGVRHLIGGQIAGARAWLDKGWPLCEFLGPGRGRILAFLLRWHAATLSAIEARNGDVFRGPPPAGLFRLAACVMASAAGRGTPW